MNNPLNVLTDEMVTATRIFAHNAFEDAGVKRKYTGDDYITHSDNIIAILEEYGLATNRVRIVANLHDVVEDTNETRHNILYFFSSYIAVAVAWLTDVDDDKLNRKQRNEINNERLQSAPGWIQDIKIADSIDNLRSIAEHDLAFAPVYIEEIRSRCSMFEDANPKLTNLLAEELEKAEDKIEEEYKKQQGDLIQAVVIETPQENKVIQSVMRNWLMRLDLEMQRLCRDKQQKRLGIRGSLFHPKQKPTIAGLQDRAIQTVCLKLMEIYGNFYTVEAFDPKLIYDTEVLIRKRGPEVKSNMTVFVLRYLCTDDSVGYIHLPLTPNCYWSNFNDESHYTFVIDESLDYYSFIFDAEEFFNKVMRGKVITQ